MIKVFVKGFKILELIAENPEKPFLLNEISQTLSIALPTCAHILQSLTSLGYLEKYGKRQGYILGPMSYALSCNGPYLKNLITVAKPLIDKCAQGVEESVVLATFKNNKRYVLYVANGNPEIEVKHSVFYCDDVYKTVTGRLLLAYISEKERNEYIDSYGNSGLFWPGTETNDEIRLKLEQIKKKGSIVDVVSDKVLSKIAFPVRQKNKVIAALGIAIPKPTFNKKNKKMFVEECEKTALAITQKLKEN